MFGIIAVLIVLIFLIIFYKLCGNRKSLFYKVLLFIGAIPFIYNLIISFISAKSGFTLFDFTPVYGLKAFTTCFSVYCFFYFHVFIPAGIAVIIAIINIIKLKLKRDNKNEQKKIKKILQFSLIIIVLLITLIISILYVQPSLFFYPWHDEKSYNQLLNEENFEEIKINNNGKLLNGWIKYNTEEQQAPLLIFFGGNAQNSSNTCLNFLHTDKYKYFEGYNLMIIDYPGYGLSDGKPSDKTMFDSALKVYDYASQLDCVDEDNIVVLGYSIGTGVATYVASQRNVNGLILVAPYDEALSLYNDTVNIFHGPLKLLARYKFNSIYYAQSVNISPLIITSYHDEVISYKFSLNLAEYFNNVDKTIVLDNNVKHNDYFSQEDVLINIHRYLKNRL